MKLFIKRDQKAHTGLLGGSKGMIFILSYRLELTPEESALVTKYKIEEYPLTFQKDGRDREGNQIPSMTVRRLMFGGKDEVKDITVLLNNEQVLKDACSNFKTLLGIMSTFGGEEVVDFGNDEIRSNSVNPTQIQPGQCVKCGTLNESGKSFCRNCGTKVE